jgi:hypothetical protein
MPWNWGNGAGSFWGWEPGGSATGYLVSVQYSTTNTYTMQFASQTFSPGAALPGDMGAGGMISSGTYAYIDVNNSGPYFGVWNFSAQTMTNAPGLGFGIVHGYTLTSGNAAVGVFFLLNVTTGDSNAAIMTYASGGTATNQYRLFGYVGIQSYGYLGYSSPTTGYSLYAAPLSGDSLYKLNSIDFASLAFNTYQVPFISTQMKSPASVLPLGATSNTTKAWVQMGSTSGAVTAIINFAATTSIAGPTLSFETNATGAGNPVTGVLLQETTYAGVVTTYSTVLNWASSAVITKMTSTGSTTLDLAASSNPGSF